MSTAAITADAFAQREFPFSRRNFAHIAAVLRAQSGIHLTEAKAMLVYSRLAKRLRKIDCRDFDDYCALIDSEAGREERAVMLTALTTNVTRFYREPHHFEHLKTKVAPALVEKAKRGERVRLWSAACSSGEEPYSMALSLLEACPEAASYDIRILATDIDAKILQTARAGVYSDDRIAPVPLQIRSRWFTRCETDSWAARDDLRALIAFRELNLNGAWPMRGAFDVIFCRNVVIYFDDATQATLWNRFCNILTPGGRLYVGHSERVDVAGFASDGLTVYRRTRGQTS